MKKLTGVITAMTTPFDARDRVDLDAVKSHCDFLIQRGVNCLYPCGTTGEMYLCSPEEREAIAKAVVDQTAGRVPVFIHVGAMRQDETIRLAKHACAIGADGIGVVTPSYFTVDDRAMVEYYTNVCQAVPGDFPVYAYAIPQLARNELTCPTLERIIKACPNLIGIKYSYPDMSQLIKYMRLRDGTFSVVFGADHLFLSALAAGADGTVSGCSSAIPEPFVEVYKHYLAGDWKAAEAAQLAATNAVWLLKGGADMSVFKNVMTMRGVPGGGMRKPLLDLPDAEVARLKEAIAPYIK